MGPEPQRHNTNIPLSTSPPSLPPPTHPPTHAHLLQSRLGNEEIVRRKHARHDVIRPGLLPLAQTQLRRGLKYIVQSQVRPLLSRLLVPATQSVPAGPDRGCSPLRVLSSAGPSVRGPAFCPGWVEPLLPLSRAAAVPCPPDRPPHERGWAGWSARQCETLGARSSLFPGPFPQHPSHAHRVWASKISCGDRSMPLTCRTPASIHFQMSPPRPHARSSRAGAPLANLSSMRAEGRKPGQGGGRRDGVHVRVPGRDRPSSRCQPRSQHVPRSRAAPPAHLPVDQLTLDGVVELLQRRTRPCCPGSQGILGAGVLIGMLVVVVSGVFEGVPVHAGSATPRRSEPAGAAVGSVRGRQVPHPWVAISRNGGSSLCKLRFNKGCVHAKWMDMRRAVEVVSFMECWQRFGASSRGSRRCGTGQAAVVDLPRHPMPPTSTTTKTSRSVLDP